MITERTLRKWRKEALLVQDKVKDSTMIISSVERSVIKIYVDRVIRLTGDLLDIHLVRKERF